MKEKIVLSLVLAFLVILIILPLCVMFLLSIVPSWSSAFPTSFSAEWWLAILTPKFLKVILNTVLVTVMSTLSTVGYAIIASYLFTFYNFKGREILSALILSPTYVAGVVLALGLLTMYPAIRNTFWILMLGHFVVISPVVFRCVLSSMVKIPANLIEASSSLGSSKENTFWRIILPLSRKGILAGGILSIGMNISELSVSLLLFGADWVTIPIQIYLERGWGILGIASVLSTILIIITLATVFFVNYLGEKNL